MIGNKVNYGNLTNSLFHRPADGIVSGHKENGDKGRLSCSHRAAGCSSNAFRQEYRNCIKAFGRTVCQCAYAALSLLIPGAFGGGDIKLMAAAGLFLGWKSTVISAVLAVFAAGAYGLYIRMIKKAGRGQCFPFGPFLCAGMAAAVLWGKELWEFWLKL